MRALAFFKVLVTCLFINTAFSLSVSAQRDVIITQASEEIRCRILDETPTRFIYAYVGPKGDILRNEIFKNLVRDFKYNKYDSDLPLASTKKGKTKKNKKSQDISLANSDSNKNDSTEKKAKVAKKVAKKDKVDEIPVEPKKSKKELRKERKAAEDEEKLALENSEESKKKELLNETAVELEEEVLGKNDEPLKEEVISETAKNIKPVEEGLIKEELVIEDSKEPLKKAEEKVITDTKSANINPEQVAKEEPAKESNDLEPVEEQVETLVSAPNVLPEEKKLTEIPEESKPVIAANSVESTGEFKNYLKWRVGVKAGIGNILDKDFEASNAYGLYQEKLLKGYTFGADLAFFPLEGFGLGVVYTDFRSSNSSENLTFINEATGVEMTGSISNKVSRKFIGPAFFLRKGIDFKTFVVLGVGPGMYFYNNKGDYNQANFEYTGKEFGGAATLGLDFLLGNDIIGRDIILSLEAGYNMGKINDIDYGDGTGMLTLDNPIIMDRLDFSIGLRFMRFPKYLKK